METSVIDVEEKLNEINPKMHYSGKVVKITLAFALVDIGLDKPGVIHISQLISPNPEKPGVRVEDVLQVGQTIDVWVRKVKEGRIELTMVKPLDLEWRDIKKGMVVKGIVVRLEKFGAFVEIGAERPGLIHISEMAHGYVRTPSEVVKEGDEVEAQILEVNRRKKQIKLSLKALQEEPPKEEPAKVIETVQKERANRRKNRTPSENINPGDTTVLTNNIEATPTAEADPTAMEIAIREAMEKAKARRIQQDRSKRSKNISKEQEDILSRTLENKVRTS